MDGTRLWPLAAPGSAAHTRSLDVCVDRARACVLFDGARFGGACVIPADARCKWLRFFLSDLRNARTGTSLHAVCCKEAYARARYLFEESLTVTATAVPVAQNENEHMHSCSRLASLQAKAALFCVKTQLYTVRLLDKTPSPYLKLKQLFLYMVRLLHKRHPLRNAAKQMEFHGGKAEMEIGKA